MGKVIGAISRVGDREPSFIYRLSLLERHISDRRPQAPLRLRSPAAHQISSVNLWWLEEIDSITASDVLQDFIVLTRYTFESEGGFALHPRNLFGRVETEDKPFQDHCHNSLTGR